MRKIAKLFATAIFMLASAGLSETFAVDHFIVEFDQGVSANSILDRARNIVGENSENGKSQKIKLTAEDFSPSGFTIKKLGPGPVSDNAKGTVGITTTKTRYITPCEKIPPFGLVNSYSQECTSISDESCDAFEASVSKTSLRKLSEIPKEIISIEQAMCGGQKPAENHSQTDQGRSNQIDITTMLGNIFGPFYPFYRDSEEFQEAKNLFPILQRYPESISGKLLAEWPPIVQERCSLLSLTQGLDCEDSQLFERRERLREWDKVVGARYDLLQADYQRLKPICEAPRPPGQPWPVECTQFNNCVDIHNAEDKRRLAAWDVFKRDLETLRKKYLGTFDRYEADTKIQKEWTARAKGAMSDAGNVVTVHTQDSRIPQAPRIAEENLTQVTREIASKMVAIVADKTNRALGRDHTFGIDIAAKKARQFLNNHIGSGFVAKSWDFGSVGEYRFDVEVTGKYPYVENP